MQSVFVLCCIEIEDNCSWMYVFKEKKNRQEKENKNGRAEMEEDCIENKSSSLAVTSFENKEILDISSHTPLSLLIIIINAAEVTMDVN